MIGVGAAEDGARGRRVGARVSERDAWIALSQLPGIGPAGFARLVRLHGSALEAWRVGAPAIADLGGDPEAADVMAAGLREDPREIARDLAERTARTGGRVVTSLDEDYPAALFTLDPRPPVLFVMGPADAYRQRAVAIVGTRRASGYGLSVATEIGTELALAGVAVVSGLALGIDGAAHEAALASTGTTIAVLPSPLDRIYPPRHRTLARRIVAGGGALVSEIAIGAAVGRPDFARRNRIIAGLAEAVVVVEAPDRSGALLTAASAVSIGREVYAVPGPIDALASRGCNRLVADQHARIVTSSAALLREIGFARRTPPPTVSALSEVEGQLLKRLLERSGSIEELVDRSGQPPAAVASALTLLEARGLVSAFGAATFHPTLAARRLARVV
jgi:DNA processing protein